MSTIRKALSAIAATALSVALLPIAATGPAFAVAPDSPQPHIPASDGPADCVPYVGDPVKGYGQYPLGLRAPDYGVEGYDELPLASAALQKQLPSRVDLRDNHQGFNQRVEVALRDGNLFVRFKDKQQWREAPVPSCLRGKLVGISINEDALIGVDEAGWMYTMSNLLSSPTKWGWIRAFGGPFWFGDGLQSPNITPGKWALSLIGTQTDKTYLDPAGKQQPVSLAKCTQVVVLSQDGARIYSLDPWLAQDYAYEVSTPYNSRFLVETVSASGSVVFVTNKYGDMFVRQSDFDVNGSDPAQFRYTWQDDNRPVAEDALQHRLDSSTAAIKLPPRDWQQLPKIPGTITNRISIHSTAPGSQHRELRVEGKKEGHTGYWYRSLIGKEWHFMRTGQPLKGKILENSARDRSRDTLRAPSPFNYAGKLTEGVLIRVKEFAYASVTRPVEITIGRKNYTLLLHTVDGRLGTPLTMRLLPVESQFGARPAGLVSDVKRNYVAAFEVPEEVWKQASSDPALAKFLSNYLQGQRVHEVFLRVTTQEMEIINSPIEGVAAPLVSDVATLSAY
ncbi:MAG: hypothetical protein WAN89_06720 [Lawsonella sp.]